MYRSTAPRYVSLDSVPPEALAALLNKPRIREHLVAYPRFGPAETRSWVSAKLALDASRGCRIRAILLGEQLAGWCGIQPDCEQYELAIVLDESFWGMGPRVYRTLLEWAAEMGHETVNLHLLHTRREYRFIRRIARAVRRTRLHGASFTTYELQVGARSHRAQKE